MHLLIGLGGNIGNPEETSRRALVSLDQEHPIVAVSRLYRTRPVGPKQPDFSNLAAVIELRRSLPALLATCHRLEEESGRVRSREGRWGPRALDIDLLLAEGVVCRGPSLELPHPGLHERAFALAPAAEVAPEWTHPLLGRTVRELADEVREKDPGAILGVSNFEFSILNSQITAK
jgi:2-amino-4-hydroxy-6-hydroxymethyldihydropteridine diphosphokinase